MCRSAKEGKKKEKIKRNQRNNAQSKMTEDTKIYQSSK